MASLTPQIPTVLGTDLTGVTPTATTGDDVPIDSTVLVSNGSGSPITVTVVVPGNDSYGTARPDYTHSVPAGGLTSFRKLPADLADPTTQRITLICSSVGSVKLFVVQ